MDMILGLFKSLDTFQIILLGAGVFLLWPTIQKYLGDFWNSPAKEGTENGKGVVLHDHDSELTDLVCKWECLCKACHKHNLHDACEKLKEVFPMLVDAHKEEEHEKQEGGVH